MEWDHIKKHLSEDATYGTLRPDLDRVKQRLTELEKGMIALNGKDGPIAEMELSVRRIEDKADNIKQAVATVRDTVALTQAGHAEIVQSLEALSRDRTEKRARRERNTKILIALIGLAGVIAALFV